MTTWGFVVFSPVGGSGRTINKDNSYVRQTGLRMQVTPEGDCREATFDAKGSGLGVSPLDCVQITYEGQPLFYGEVRVGGNVHDVHGHQYTLRSVALRLREVAVPAGWSAPRQQAHLTVQSLISAVLPQLGGSIAGISVQDLGFDCIPIKNLHQQNPYAVLEKIAADGAALNVKVRFGVDANRIFFCRVARDDSVHIAYEDCTSNTRYTAPVAENPVTAVLWYVAKTDTGNWLTHLSVADEAAIYGTRVKPLSLTSSEGIWETAPMTLSVSSGAQVDTWVSQTADGYWQTTHDLQSAVPRLTNGAGATEYTVARVYINKGQSAAQLSLLVATDAQRLTLDNEHGFVGDIPDPAVQGQTIPSRVDTWVSVAHADGTPIAKVQSGQAVTLTGQINTLVLSQHLAARPAPHAYWDASLWLHEVRPERINTALLDKLAKYHYKIPAATPADIELHGFHSGRQGRVTLGSWQSPVEAWEYRLSAAKGMCTGILAGQADDPTALAQAELIRARDRESVITAVTSRG